MLAAFLAAALTTTATGDSTVSCMPVARPGAAGRRRPVLPEDLARLRDIGPAAAPASENPIIAISPDGRRAAFQVHQARPERNAYCIALVVVELRPGAVPKVVDTGDELIRVRLSFRNRLDYPFGLAQTVTPRWSPDGRSIAYLKQVSGRIQAWEAAADGSGARQLTRLPEGVDDLRYTPDGSGLVLASRPDAPSRHAALELEGRTGFRYDERFAPALSLRPLPAGPAPTSHSFVATGSGEVRAATGTEAAQYATDAIEGVNQGTTSATSPLGQVASIRPDPDALLARRQKLTVHSENAPPLACAAASCLDRIATHWWSKDGTRLQWLRREGAYAEVSAVYEWLPGSGQPRRMYATTDVLLSCVPAARALACLRETSTRPRHLVLLDPAARRIETVFDPNPEWQALELGRVERLALTDAFGIRLFADLVYPVGHRPGTRHPLVVVQYQSRGFLRGGTGDEYPIQAFAGRGMMVLSVDRPSPLAYAPNARSFTEIDRALLKDFRYRRGVHSSLERAIATLVARGVVDPARVGLTGLSEGASAVQYALAHDPRFAAAAMSGCCWGPGSTSLGGLAAARDYRFKGYPSWASPEGPAFWRELSLVPHAQTMRTPLLVQASDDEMLEAIDAYTTLREAKAPVELIVYPGEHHTKWQPAHRLAVYRRNVEWFSFWFGSDSAAHPDMSRWLELSQLRPDAHRSAAPDWSRPSVRPDQ